jgi:hypothetical protein
VILSRSRSRSITSHKLFPTATLLVPASEAEHYAHTGLEIVTIPDEIAGISAVRNWVLRYFKEDAIVMLDIYELSLKHQARIQLPGGFQRDAEGGQAR